MKISTGDSHSACIDSNGDLHVWGSNNLGRLGLGHTTNRLYPTKVNLGTKKAVEVSCGGLHTLVLCDDGKIYGTGNNHSGQLGDGTTTSPRTSFQAVLTTGSSTLSGKTITKVYAGGSQSYALDSTGVVHCWGSNTSNGFLGVNTTVDIYSTPTLLDTTAGSSLQGKVVIQVSATNVRGATALCDDGTVHGWGNQNSTTAYIGNGTKTNQSRPVATDVSSSSSLYDETKPNNRKHIVYISSRHRNTIAIDSDGMVHVWGRGASGIYNTRVGDGTTEERLIPVSLSYDETLSSMFGKKGYMCTCANQGGIIVDVEGKIHGFGYIPATTSNFWGTGSTASIEALHPVLSPTTP